MQRMQPCRPRPPRPRLRLIPRLPGLRCPVVSTGIAPASTTGGRQQALTSRARLPARHLSSASIPLREVMCCAPARVTRVPKGASRHRQVSLATNWGGRPARLPIRCLPRRTFCVLQRSGSPRQNPQSPQARRTLLRQQPGPLSNAWQHPSRRSPRACVGPQEMPGLAPAFPLRRYLCARRCLRRPRQAPAQTPALRRRSAAHRLCPVSLPCSHLQLRHGKPVSSQRLLQSHRSGLPWRLRMLRSSCLPPHRAARRPLSGGLCWWGAPRLRRRPCPGHR